MVFSVFFRIIYSQYFEYDLPLNKLLKSTPTITRIVAPIEDGIKNMSEGMKTYEIPGN